MSTPALRVPDDVLVHHRRARDHADSSYPRSLTLEEMAAVACLSKYHFVRLFKSTYGITPMEYVSRRRIERALDEGGMPGLGLNVEDCQATFEELSAKGVEFIQPPSQRPYGTEALCRDNSGNWLVLIQPATQPYSADDFERETVDRR